jgi:molecular chaperone DnaK (HSP70)
MDNMDNNMDHKEIPSLSEITGIKHKPTGTQPSIEKEILSNRDGGRVNLTNDEFKEANKLLNETGFVEKFSRTFKYSADPIFRDQIYCLHSFVPSKGAKPDKDGVFGMIKFRGTFPSQQETNEKAEEIIREMDSYNSVFHGYVGKWFPVTKSSKYTREVHEIDIQKKTKGIVSDSIKQKRKEDRQEIEQINQREKELREDVKIKPEDRDPIERYIELKVKKANCMHTLERYKKDIEKLQKIVDNSQEILSTLDEENSDFKDKYVDIYRKAREQVGLPIGETETLISYMQI